MKRNWLMTRATGVVGAFAGAILVCALFGSVPARGDIDVHIDISSAPPPPRFVFQARPQERFLRDRRVYVVDDPRIGDYDCFRYGGYYWAFRDGYWYRSRSWRSRFVVVHPRYVPAVFYQVPPAHWKHRPSGPPPGLYKKGGRPPGQMKKSDTGPPGQPKKGDKGGRGK